MAETARAEGNDFFKKGKFPDAIKKYDEGMKRTPDTDKVFKFLYFYFAIYSDGFGSQAMSQHTNFLFQLNSI